MQDKVWNRKSFCLDRLTPGSTYQLCVAPEDCQNSWNCKSFTTFETNSAHKSLYELTVNIEGRDSDWIQLSWPPPKLRRPATPPFGYIILVRSAENCLEKVIHFQAPWVRIASAEINCMMPLHLRTANKCTRICFALRLLKMKNF